MERGSFRAAPDAEKEKPCSATSTKRDSSRPPTVRRPPDVRPMGRPIYSNGTIYTVNPTARKGPFCLYFQG